MKSQERRMKILLLLQSRTRNITIDYLAEYFERKQEDHIQRPSVTPEHRSSTDLRGGIGYCIMKGYNIPP